jgi:putative transcriptional regulator
MPIIKTNPKNAVKKLKQFNWSRVDAMTDRDLARQVAANPDAAPDITAALREGSMQRPIKPEEIKAVRRKTGLSQALFAARLRLNVATIRNWEQGRTHPDAAAVTLLTIIDREPKMVMQTLQSV